MSTQTDMEKLIYHLNLSPYQATQVYLNRDEYNMSRLQMRGGVLFAPRNVNVFVRFWYGGVGDVIGRRRTFLRGARRVRLIAGGYFTGRIGRSVCYGAPDGILISPQVFNRMARKSRTGRAF